LVPEVYITRAIADIGRLARAGDDGSRKELTFTGRVRGG
jgi:hypothetical protein